MSEKVELADCENSLRRWIGRIPNHVRLAFVSALAFGLLIHMYMLTNKLPNHDDIVCLFYDDALIECGRWFGAVLCALSSNFSMPWVNGLLSVLALSGVSAMVVWVLDIRRPLPVLLTSAVLLAFPSVGNTLAFLFTADGYFEGLLLGVIGVYLIDRKKWGFLPGALLVMLCTAAYQAYLCFCVSLLAVRGLQMLLRREKSDREIWITLAKYAAAILIAVGLYLVTARLAMRVCNIQASAYMGIDTMGQIKLSEIPRMIVSAYRGFFEFAFVTSGIHTGLWLSIAHLVIGLSVAGLFVLILCRRKLRSTAQTVLAVVVLLLMPMIMNSAHLLGAALVHILMMYGIALIYPLLLVLYDIYASLPDEGARLRQKRWTTVAASWITAISVAFSASCWSIYTNQAYFELELKYENIYAMCVRVVDRVETSPDYTVGMPVAFIGELFEGNYPHSKDGNFGSLGDAEGFGSSSEMGFIYDDRHVKDYVRAYLGVVFELTDAATLDAIANDPRFLEMPCYPYADSVQLIDGVLVVKLGN